MIRGLWAYGTDCIVDVRIADHVDAKSNRSRDPVKVLAAHERQKKKKQHLRGVSRARTSALFSVSVASADGLRGSLEKPRSSPRSAKKPRSWSGIYPQHSPRSGRNPLFRGLRPPISASVDPAFRRAECATASRSGRTKQASVSSDNRAPLTAQRLQHSPPAPTSPLCSSSRI